MACKEYIIAPKYATARKEARGCAAQFVVGIAFFFLAKMRMKTKSKIEAEARGRMVRV